VEPDTDHRGLRRLEATRVFAEMAFQKCLINSHALFSLSKMDGNLKFEPQIDQILNGADHEAKTGDELRLFRCSFALDLRCC
jgi:hypothetical protein